MTVLRRGYVPVEPDTTGFDDKLKDQFRKQDPGGKAGKQLGGQLNRALKRLDLDPVDVQADPKKAYAAILATEKRLKELGRSAETVEIKIKTEQAISQLGRFKKQLGDVGQDAGPEAAVGFFAQFGAKLGPLMAKVPISGPLAGAAGAAALVAAPIVASTLAGAVVGGAGIGGILGGVALAVRDEQVKTAGKELGSAVLGDLERRSRFFVPAVLGGIDQIRAGYAELGPDLDKIFSSSRYVERFTGGLLAGAKGFISGFAEAVEQADPVVEALSNGIAQIGVATGGVFRLMAQDADEGASAIQDLTGAVANFITISGQVIHAGATMKGYGDELDKVLDKGRYWLEDNGSISGALEDIGVKLDLTADGFAAGSVQAEAYRKATLGTADAADFATLKQAGMTDAAITGADASGRYRAEIDLARKATLELAVANGTLVASEDQVKEAQEAATFAQQDLTRSLEGMGVGAGYAAKLVDGLKKATDQLYGAQIGATEANEGYQASWDALSESVKKNKGTLDIHTAAGRSNRDSLQALLTSTKDLYFAEIATGTSIEGATKKHQNRIAAVREEARRVGLNRTETEKLIGTYGAIPKKKQTDLVVAGVNKVVQALKDLYVFQRSLAEGIPIDSMIAKLKGEKGPAKRYGGYHDGGRTPLVGEYEPAGVVHGKEFVFDAATVRKVDRQAPGFLDEVHATGQLPGYAAGGRVADVDTSTRWPFTTDAGHTKVPTRAQVAAKVVPAFSGDWPASPAAQRGDSGIWRKVAQLIRSTGPLSGSFGNGYRPGDPKWHGSGRAVDWMGYNQDALARFLAARRPLELIHRTKERDYAYTRGVNKGSFNNSLMNAHKNHIHIAMAGGGVIGEPVAGVGMRSGNSYSFGERGPETVTPGVGGGGDVHLHFHNSVITSKKQAEDLVVEAWTSAKRGKRIRA